MMAVKTEKQRMVECRRFPALIVVASATFPSEIPMQSILGLGMALAACILGGHGNQCMIKGAGGFCGTLSQMVRMAVGAEILLKLLMKRDLPWFSHPDLIGLVASYAFFVTGPHEGSVTLKTVRLDLGVTGYELAGINEQRGSLQNGQQPGNEQNGGNDDPL